MLRQILIILALGAACFAQCSLNTVRGAWAYYSQGQLMPGFSWVPYAGLGVEEIDDQGRFTAHGKMNVGGQMMDFAFSGSITVNPDCTATETYTLPGIPVEGADRLMILDSGNEMRSIGLTGVMGAASGIGSFRRISWAEPQCSSNMIHGVYTGSLEASFVFGPQTQPLFLPYAGLYTIRFPWNGKGSGISTTTQAIDVTEYAISEATLLVNKDCTASVEWRSARTTPPIVAAAPPKVESGLFVVLNNGAEMISLQQMDTVGALIGIGKYKRISVELTVGPTP